MQGAASYDISIDKSDGTHSDFSGFRTAVASFIKMTGTGVFHWRVRAEFPKDTTGTVPGPYSATQTFTRTIGEPVNARTDSDKTHVLLSWDPRLGVQQYKVQISSTTDFSRVVETVGTENPSYAPTMTQYAYQSGGTLYWRVAGVDEDRNQGDWTEVQQIRLQPRLRLSLLGGARRKFKSRVTARVLNGQGRPVAGVRVRVRGVGVRSVARRTNTKGQVVFTLKPRKRRQAGLQRDEARIPACVPVAERPMKAEQAVKPVRREQPAQPAFARRIWRVFESPPPGPGAAALSASSPPPPRAGLATTWSDASFVLRRALWTVPVLLVWVTLPSG